MLVLGAAEVADRLPWGRLIDALGKGVSGETSAPVMAPERHYHAPEASSDLLMIMPAWTARWMGIKSYAVFPEARRRGGDGIASTYALIDRQAGCVAAILDGLVLTNRRTAAASALAADALARDDAETLLVMGTGGLASLIAGAHASVRPYRHILIWGRDGGRAELVASGLRADGFPAEAAADAQKAAGIADVITCVTGSALPILHGAWLRPGTHVDLVGAHQPHAREADSDLIASALIYADVRANVLREAGDILIPTAEGRIGADAIQGELIDLVGQSRGRMRKGADTTVFKSVGFAAADMIAALTALGEYAP